MATPSASGWTGGAISTLVTAGAAGLIAALLPDVFSGIIVGLAVTAVLIGAIRPGLLVPLVAIGVVMLPPYVGLLLPGGGFVNVLRGVLYGAVCGFLVWELRAALRGHLELDGGSTLVGGWSFGWFLLAAGWVVAPVIGFTHGFSNGAKALNMVLYQALPFAVGLGLGKQWRGIRVLQITFFGLLLYTLPFWLYELESGVSLFRSYVAPIPGLLGGRPLLLREGAVRAQATFGHPLAFDQFLLLAVPVAASMIADRRLSLLGLTGLILGMAAIAATGSRSAWIALFLASVLVAAVRCPKATLAVCAFVLLTATTMPGIRGRLDPAWIKRHATSLSQVAYSPKTEAQFSAASRVLVMVSAARAIGRHPVRGYGINVSSSSAGIPTVDNYYLLLPVEVGLPAASLIIFGLGWSIVAICKRACRRLETGALWYAVVAYMAELLFVGLHDTISLLFLVAGFLFAMDRRNTSEDPQTSQSHLVPNLPS